MSMSGQLSQGVGWKHVLHRPLTPSSRSPFRVETIVPALSIALLFFLSFSMISQNLVPLPNGTGLSVGSEQSSSPRPYAFDNAHPESEFSFDVDQAHNPDWMKELRDNVSMAALSIPGTHDTLTHRLAESHRRLQCQNADLETQLNAGIRYIDVRARLNISRSYSSSRPHSRDDGNIIDDGEMDYEEEEETRPGTLLIYHGSAYTGYTFTDVMKTLFSFLEAHPSEAIIMRLQREGGPVHVGPDPRNNGGSDTSIRILQRQSSSSFHATPQTRSRSFPSLVRRNDDVGRLPEDGHILERRGKSWGADPAFEKAFNYYRTLDQDTVPGFAKHFYGFPSMLEEDDKKIPTLGQARGKVVMLQDFDGARGTRNVYGLPWDESDPRLKIEDLWILTGPKDIERKWRAVSRALEEAAEQPDPLPGPLFLSHLSASVAVLPVQVAAGMMDPDTRQWHEGINDRTGKLLEGRNGEGIMGGKTGVLMADFPGRRLVEEIIERNTFVLG